MNELFRGPIPNDAKDLLTFILMQLHEELNKPKNNIYIPLNYFISKNEI
jgi:ubiquitin C-terminal hydrolase